ncbi:hypothetical protein EB796_007002 [Bugula neritina]|uniref:Uncharacterized protein n=1 Tax=Bugula neritina TaxID=10212 RepID=A0A7J7K8X9_BUGNE|nr:hypothetical protein EB796_007002 [Bugula neritina]
MDSPYLKRCAPSKKNKARCHNTGVKVPNRCRKLNHKNVQANVNNKNSLTNHKKIKSGPATLSKRTREVKSMTLTKPQSSRAIRSTKSLYNRIANYYHPLGGSLSLKNNLPSLKLKMPIKQGFDNLDIELLGAGLNESHILSMMEKVRKLKTGPIHSE